MCGEPLAMVAYRIVILPLIKRLTSSYPDAKQPWYTDDAGALGMFDHLEIYFKALKRNGPSRGYYPKPTKSILIVRLQNPKAGDLFCRCRRLKVCTGALYLGGCI